MLAIYSGMCIIVHSPSTFLRHYLCFLLFVFLAILVLTTLSLKDLNLRLCDGTPILFRAVAVVPTLVAKLLILVGPVDRIRRCAPHTLHHDPTPQNRRYALIRAITFVVGVSYVYKRTVQSQHGLQQFPRSLFRTERRTTFCPPKNCRRHPREDCRKIQG